MAKWTVPTDLGKITDNGIFMRFCSQAIKDLQAIINGKIDFSSNITNQIISVTFGAANTDLLIQHDLNKLGVNFIVVNKTKTCDVFHGLGKDALDKIYLQSSVANNTVSIMLF
jgi:hypothetical protein